MFSHFDPLSPFQCCKHVTVSTKCISTLKRGFSYRQKGRFWNYRKMLIESICFAQMSLTMRQLLGTVATLKNQIFCFCTWIYIHDICTEVALQQFTMALQRFTMITYHNKKSTCYFLNWRCEPWWTDWNLLSCSCKLWKKQNLHKQQNQFSPFCLNVSSKTISWNNSRQ